MTSITRCKVYRTTVTTSSGGRTSKPGHNWWATVESTYGKWNYLMPSWSSAMREVNRQLRTQRLEELAKQAVGGYYKDPIKQPTQ